MTTIQAWQHIFSNVEKEQSPRKRGGFQTLFHSVELTNAEVEETEARFLYFASKTDQPLKRLFFTIASGKGVVGQIVFLPAPDQFGRGGRYFAHGLVFAPDALAEFQADPFRVFRTFNFITTVDEALAQGDFQSGHIKSVSLDLPNTLAGEVKAARNWSTPELKQLTLLALRVEKQTQERNAITFTGPAQQIEAALEAAFLAVPVSMRPQCSFDTYFYHCNLVSTYFWAIGLPKPSVTIKFAQVNSQTRQAEGDVPTQLDTAYERWVMQSIDVGKLSDIARQRDYAFALGEWLDERSYTLALLDQASPDLINNLFKASPQSVQNAVRRGVAQKLPEETVDRAAAYIYRHTSEQALYKQLRQGFELPHLVQILYDSYVANSFDTPARSEVKALQKLLEQSDHNMLRLFVAYWASLRKELPKALKVADKADYQQFVSTVLKLELIKPFKLLLPERVDDFLDVYLAYDYKNLPDLAETLMKNEHFEQLIRLNDHVGPLSRKNLNKLARLIAEFDQTPKTFQTSVDKAINALPPDEGLIGKIKSLFGD